MNNYCKLQPIQENGTIDNSGMLYKEQKKKKKLHQIKIMMQQMRKIISE